MEIHPSKITIRPFKITDVDFILWARDDQITRNLMWETITSREEASAYIEDVCIPDLWRRSIWRKVYMRTSREYWNRGVA